MAELFEDEASLRMHQIWVDGLREQVKAPDDWRYIRRSFLTPEYQEKLLGVIGDANYKLASGHRIDGSVSMSIFISPEGIENVKAKAYRKELGL